MTQSELSSSVNKSLLRGTAWMIGARWLTRCIGLVSMVILARLLAPEDYGLVAMAMLAYGLLETIAYAGVDLALMRQGADTRAHYDTAWTVQLIQNCVVAALLLIAAPLTAAYFSEPRAVAVIQLIALRSVIEGAQNIGIVAFRKELDFAKEFRFMLYNKLANFIVIVAAAYWFRNYWALVIGSVSASVIGLMLSYAMHPYRPRLSLAKSKEIWSFSQWLMISRVGSFLNRKADEFIVGGAAGTAAIGAYHFASDLATTPSIEVVMPMRRALFPSLAKLTSQPDQFARMVRDSFSSVAVLCFSVGFGLMAVAPEFVQVFLGPKWVETVPLIQWLAVFGAFTGLTLLLEVPLWVSGRTKWTALQTWLELAALVPAAWFAVHEFGIVGAAAARTCVAITMVPIMMHISVRAGSVSYTDLIGAVWRPLLSGALMALTLYALVLPATMSPVAAFSIKVLLGMGAFPAILIILWWASGRPTGFEASALGKASALLAGRKSVP